jgi:hypothetical protein
MARDFEKSRRWLVVMYDGESLEQGASSSLAGFLRVNAEDEDLCRSIRAEKRRQARVIDRDGFLSWDMRAISAGGGAAPRVILCVVPKWGR